MEMNTDYTELAGELVNMRGSRPQIRLDRAMSKSVEADIFVLKYVHNHEGDVHPKDLSDGLMVSTARMAVILKRLEQEGLISRIPDGADNRQTIVRISDKGAAIIKRQHDEIMSFIVKMLEALGPEDAREYVRIKKKMMQIIAERQ